MKKNLLLLSLFTFNAFASGIFNLPKEALKRTNDPYNPELDITCEEMLNLKQEVDRAGKAYSEYRKQNPGDKKRIKALEKEFETVQKRDQEIHANFEAKAILFERVTGKKAIPYDDTIWGRGYWNAQNACSIGGEKYASYPLSQVLLLTSESLARLEMTIQAQQIRNLTENLKECEEGKNPATIKSSRNPGKDIPEEDESSHSVGHSGPGKKQ